MVTTIPGGRPLTSSARCYADGTVSSHNKVSDTSGFLATNNAGGVLANDDHFGRSLTSLGDLDGDGDIEIAVGTNGDEGAGTNRGVVYVLDVRSDGSVAGIVETRPSVVLDDGDEFGVSVSALGNLDGVGGMDLIAGAVGDGDGGGLRGATYSVFLDAAPAVCGNDVLDPVFEECDDGAMVPGDGCSASCRVEVLLPLFEGPTGAIGGGTVSVVVDGELVSIGTTPGQTAAQVAQSLALAIGANPNLMGFGVVASSSGSVLATDGTITQFMSTDIGIADALVSSVPTLPLTGFLALAAGLLTGAVLPLRRPHDGAEALK